MTQRFGQCGTDGLRATLPMVITAALAVAIPAQAQVAAPAATPPAHTLQADFDAASAAVDNGHCDQAEPIFARLAADQRIRAGSLPAAMIALRRGLCHISTGDQDQGEAWVRSGLPGVEQGGPSLAGDVANGWVALGKLAMARYDHDVAVTAYTRALAAPGMASRIDALIGLAMVTAFDGDGVALGAVDRALAAHAAEAADPAAKRDDMRKGEGSLRVLRARVLMNLGRNVEALKESEKALALSGGLSTDHVTLSDVSMRSDVAQAALLAGKPERARELLAYTGAGRIAKSPFSTARSMQVPDCDETAGLRPDDEAVVEFSIAADGQVQSAQTVYSRGNFAVARQFAQAVRGWEWQPEDVAKLPTFYRALVRVELRCSKSGGNLPGVTAPFDQRIAAWAQPVLGSGGAATGGMTPAALRQRAAAVEAAGDRTGAAALLMLALRTSNVGHPTDTADVDHAVALLSDADPARRATAALVRVLAPRANWQTQKTTSELWQDTLFKTVPDPVIAADGLVQDTARLLAVTAHRYGHFSVREIAALQDVADDTRIEPASPLRQVALLRLANTAARDGRRAEAEALFARTGLNEEQCSVIGDIPRAKNSNFDNLYPMEAARMGFEGWARTEYDIAADGRTAAPRVVIAYPPFVFVEGAKDLVKAIRYDTSFRPSGKLACSARTETVNFLLDRP